MRKDLDLIQALVGPVTYEQLCHVEGAVVEGLGLFVPVQGVCGYAVTPEHVHPAYLFVLTFNERCELMLDGRSFRVGARKICAFSPEVPHQEVENGEIPRYIAVMVAKALWESALEEQGLSLSVYRGEHFDLPNGVVQTAREFILEYGGGRAGRDAMLQAIGTQLVHRLVRALHGACGQTVALPDNPQINRAFEFIHQNLSERITVEQLAGIANISSAHFAREFKRSTGRTPMDYLRQVRLERARTLLVDGERNITEIALDCGFSSSSHFSARFSEQFRLSPSAYRNVFGKAET